MHIALQQYLKVLVLFSSSPSRPPPPPCSLRRPPGNDRTNTPMTFSVLVSNAQQVDGLGPAGALAIAREFRTPTSFVEALRQCNNTSEQTGLVQV